MKRNKRKGKKGFLLLEALLALIIFSSLLLTTLKILVGIGELTTESITSVQASHLMKSVFEEVIEEPRKISDFERSELFLRDGFQCQIEITKIRVKNEKGQTLSRLFELQGTIMKNGRERDKEKRIYYYPLNREL